MTVRASTTAEEHTVNAPLAAWPEVSERVKAIVAAMTLEEKLAQIVGYWLEQDGEVVAPMQGEMGTPGKLEDVIKHGLGQFTRVYGTRPVDPVERAAWLWNQQRELKELSRFGIPALVHEECLTGLAAWKAATFPAPPTWGATFHPELIERMGALIGASMHQLGIHQGLAPVLDVIRDARWGRVEECIAEDPYVVGTIGTSYVRGLQSAGIDATLKHFVGYSATQSGRNHAPVHAGKRELAEMMLPPFEMAVIEGGVRSVMNSYAEIDGVPAASDPWLFTELLRETWGFDGVVVADYFAVGFLEVMHQVAADRGEAAELALAAGIDIELPSGDAYLEPLAQRVRAGLVDEELINRAVLRSLRQKEQLGLLDETFDTPPTQVDLDTPEHRAIAAQIAEEGVILLRNTGVLPLLDATGAGPQKVAVIGPNSDRSEALMGCYSFANHVLAHHPGTERGFAMPTVREALAAELPGVDLVAALGCAVEGDDRSGIEAAVAAAAAAEVAIVVLGDQAGLFGRGTVGEGNDAESLDLPGVQRELAEAVIATGTPTVLVLVTGRPYAVDWALDGDAAPAAVIQAFFPGEEGGPAIAGILSGRVNPSGRLPMTMPRSAGAQPYSYLHPRLGGPSEVTATDSTPPLPFGFGLSYTTFEHSDLQVAAELPTDGTFEVSVRVSNVGDRAGADVVQLYGWDPVASVTRPVAQLVAYARVDLAAGESARVRFTVPTGRLSLCDRSFQRVVEPGEIQLWVGKSCADKEASAATTFVGKAHHVALAEPRQATVTVER